MNGLECEPSQGLLFLKRTIKKLAKAVKFEEWSLIKLHFFYDHNQKKYVLEKIKIAKLGEALTALQVNYDFQSPTSYHDVAVIQQLNNNLHTLHMDISVMEVEFAAKKVPTSPMPPVVLVKSVEEVAKSPPRYTTSSTHATSPMIGPYSKKTKSPPIICFRECFGI